jgi:uncharacterized coiled-coil protein SlyX
MAAALPEFQLASELGPSLSREEELEGMVRNLTNELEELQGRETEPQPGQKCPPAMKPEERQALLQVLSDLGERVKSLELLTAKQAKEIEDLKNAKNDHAEDIAEIRDHFPRLIGEVKVRLNALEIGPDLSESSAAKAHLSALYENMEAMGRKQVTFREASRCLRVSKSRIFQLKPLISVDERFIIVHSESHKQKELIRLRKYFE